MYRWMPYRFLGCHVLELSHMIHIWNLVSPELIGKFSKMKKKWYSGILKKNLSSKLSWLLRSFCVYSSIYVLLILTSVKNPAFLGNVLVHWSFKWNCSAEGQRTLWFFNSFEYIFQFLMHGVLDKKNQKEILFIIILWNRETCQVQKKTVFTKFKESEFTNIWDGVHIGEKN